MSDFRYLPNSRVRFRVQRHDDNPDVVRVEIDHSDSGQSICLDMTEAEADELGQELMF